MQRVAEETKHVFVLAGGGAMHLVDSLGRCRDLEYVCNLHEQACAIAADAYGQVSGNIGVALVTTGPGGTNALTGVAAAWLDSTPCLVLSGQVKRADLMRGKGVRQMGFQELDIVRIVESVTKYAVTVTDPNSIGFHMDKALFLARSGRPGPVWVDIPLDVQASAVEENNLAKSNPEGLRDEPDNGELDRKVAETIGLLNQAKRPVILLGNGVRLGKAVADFLELAEILQIPILTTWRAIDLLAEDHPLFMGRPGAVAQRGANLAQQNSDLLLILGARLDLGQTAYNHRNFARAARKIMVDADRFEIEKLDMAIDVAVCSDVKPFIRALIRQKNSIIAKDKSDWISRCREWKARYPVVSKAYWEEQGGVNNYVLVDVLSDEMSGSDLLVPGSSGACSEVTMQAVRVKPGMRIVNSPGLGSMGFGIPAAIGACLAAGGKRTVCVDGDGGFHMNSQELETVRRLNLPIKFFVLNNGGYGSIQATQLTHFGGHFVGSEASSGLTLPDTLRIASAYGLPTVRIEDHSHVRERVSDVLKAEGPVVCEVKVSPHQVTAPRISSFQRPDGVMVSRPMEDLWPFLDREELSRNMLIPPLEEP